MSEKTICPNCGGDARRVMRRVKRPGGGWAWAGWWQCMHCWHAWDGVADSPSAIFPYYVERREKQEAPLTGKEPATRPRVGYSDGRRGAPSARGGRDKKRGTSMADKELKVISGESLADAVDGMEGDLLEAGLLLLTAADALRNAQVYRGDPESTRQAMRTAMKEAAGLIASAARITKEG